MPHDVDGNLIYLGRDGTFDFAAIHTNKCRLNLMHCTWNFHVLFSPLGIDTVRWNGMKRYSKIYRCPLLFISK